MSTETPRWRCHRPGCPIEGVWQPGLEAEMDAHMRGHDAAAEYAEHRQRQAARHGAGGAA